MVPPGNATTLTPARPVRVPRSPSTSTFTELSRQVHAAGLMRRRYGYYWTKLVAAVVLMVVWTVGFVHLGESWWQLANAVVLAVLVTQIGFLGHDAAHRQIFRSGRWNDWASLVVANLLVGIGHGWWQNKHSRHHANPNKDDADPDIAIAALVLTPVQHERDRGRLLRWLVGHQGWYFFPLLLLEGLSLHVEGVKRVLRREPTEHRWVELAFLAVRLGGLLALVLLVLPLGQAAAFLGVELAMFGLYMGASFAPNHIGMPLVPARLRLDFLQRQVLVSRNIRGGWWVSVLMGGLNHQVEHHLFPSMARPHLRRAAPIVAAHCAAHGVPYTQTGLWQSYRQVVGHLNEIGLRGTDPFLCPLVAQRRADGPGGLRTPDPTRHTALVAGGGRRGPA